MEEEFPQQSGDASQVVFAAPEGESLENPAAKRTMAATLNSIEGLPSVAAIQPPTPEQFSPDGRVAFGSVLFDGQAATLDKLEVAEVVDVAQSNATDDVQVELGGQAIVQSEQAVPGAAELIGVAVAVIVLITVLGSISAMTMPLAVAFSAIALAMFMVTASTALFDIATFASTLAVMIGLGVGIDYALLVVNRFRAERGKDLPVRDSILNAQDTAGRSVLFAGITVVIALLGMLTLGISFLNGAAVAAALTVSMTMLSALTLLPALIGFYGKRIKPLRNADVEAGFWSRFSRFVQRRRLILAPVSVLVLAVIALPALGMNLGGADAGNGPEENSSRQAYDLLSEGFGPGFNGPLLIAATTPEGDPEGIEALGDRLAADPGVAAVSPPRFNQDEDAAVLQVIPSTSPQDSATTDLLSRIRDDIAPPVEQSSGIDASVGGATASQMDLSQAIADKLPMFVMIVVGLSLVLLMVVFRSIAIPIKAGLMNVITIAATLGVVTFVFQDGHLASLLGIETTAPIESMLPLFLFAIIFGLSMDYEVFLVSRMHEEWDKTHDNSYAVRHGLALTGKIVFAAALIMISVFGSFLLGEDRTIKMFGLGLASAILFDALIVRLILVPSIMHILGRANWWMPSGLSRRLPKLSVEGPSTPEAQPEGS